MPSTRRAFLASASAIAAPGCLGYTLEREADIEDMQDTIDGQAATIHDQAGQLGVKNETIDELEDTVSHQNDTIDELETVIAEHESTIQHLDEELTATERTLDETIDERDALESELADKAIELEVTEDELAEQIDKAEWLETELAETEEALLGEIESLESDIDVLLDDIDTLEAELAEKNDTIADHEATIAELEGTIETLQPETTFSDAEIDAARDIGHEFRDRVVYLWTSNSAVTGYHIGDGAYLSVAHGLTGFTWGPWAETIDGEQFSVSREKRENDLDLRYVQGEDATPALDIDDHAEPVDGEPVVVIGHPHNIGEWVISLGRYVETRDTTAVDPDHLIIDAPVRSGNSGSPAFNFDGAFLGMLTHTKWSHDGYDAPADPWLTFNEYEPYGGMVPAEQIAAQVTVWGL